MTRTNLNVLAAAIYAAAFSILVTIFRFELPRFDYWDVVFSSTKVIVGDPQSIFDYLFRGNESMMVLPKLTIYLSNTFSSGHAFLAEHILTLLLGLSSHVLLLRILDLPIIPNPDDDKAKNLRWWVVLALFWWPAVLPTYTNTWFAIQYGLTLFFGLSAVYCYELGDGRKRWLFSSYLSWIGAAMTHGTGLLLGPALAALAAFRDRRPYFSILLLAGTGLVLWTQHEVSRGVVHNVLRFDSAISESSLKFLTRVITPPMWESPLFLLVILPLLFMTVWVYARHWKSYVNTGYSVLVLWALIVWLSIWFARGGFQTHANPHYLRFFVILYSVWAMMLFDLAGIGRRPRFIAKAACALLLIVWIKGTETGISLASEYQHQIQAGAAVLHGQSTDLESLRYLYPDTEKLTRVFLPRLSQHQGYVYRDLTYPADRNEEQ